MKDKKGIITLGLKIKKIKNVIEIKCLDMLPNLHELSLNNNWITKIKGLENLTNLNELFLHGNNITEIKGLENLTYLKVQKK